MNSKEAGNTEEAGKWGTSSRQAGNKPQVAKEREIL
jgi:hypothetical protein